MYVKGGTEEEITDWSEWGPSEWETKHDHCGVCGECLLHVAQLHRCPAQIDAEILEVFQEQTGTIPARPTGMSHAEDEYADELRRRRA